MSSSDRSNSDIRSLRIEIPQSDGDNLRERLARTRWADRPRHVCFGGMQ